MANTSKSSVKWTFSTLYRASYTVYQGSCNKFDTLNSINDSISINEMLIDGFSQIQILMEKDRSDKEMDNAFKNIVKIWLKSSSFLAELYLEK